MKSGPLGSAILKWPAKLESVRKDIDGVFRILKGRFKFLKARIGAQLGEGYRRPLFFIISLVVKGIPPSRKTCNSFDNMDGTS
jgi:hypothetical protein